MANLLHAPIDAMRRGFYLACGHAPHAAQRFRATARNRLTRRREALEWRHLRREARQSSSVDQPIVLEAIMNTRCCRMLIYAAALVIASAHAVVSAADVGPSKGSLVIVGGAMQDPAIIKRFLELAGGLDAPIVVIPTAGGADEYDQNWSGLQQFRNAGATRLTVLHTKDRTRADSEEFVRPIREARGVFFTGGRQWRLADSYLNTLTHRALNDLLERGGVIGGTSAGASIQGSFLVRGDTKGAETMIGDHVEGLGFMRNVGIDQHLLKRNRQFDLLELVSKYPNLLGIGIDEDTAIVVQGDEFDVIGQSYVVIYDNQRVLAPAGTFYFLAPGDRYDLKKRQAFRPTRVMQPFERVTPIPRSKSSQ
jgi:cyanophycinase